MIAACNKNISNNVVITSSRIPDTFTLTDNGVTYTDIEDTLYGFKCSIETISEGPLFEIFNNTTAIPVFIGLYAPVNGIGVYKIAPIDSNSSNIYHQVGYLFTEIFNGGEAYDMDSLLMNVTTDSATTIIGSYQLWISNAGGNKTVTGTFSCHHLLRN